MGIAVFAVVVSIVTLALWVFLFFRFRARLSPDAVLRSIRIEADKIVKEIDAATDRSLTLLEAKRKSLAAFTVAADKRITLAEDADAAYSREQAILAQLAADKGSTAPAKRAASAYQREDAHVLKQERTQTLRITRAAEQIVPKKSTQTQVLELSGSGFTADLIAHKLSLPVREVETIIDLYGN